MEEGDKILSSSRVRYSDQMMVKIRGKTKLKIALLSEPSSRRLNPVGYRPCYGLPRVERVINICSDLFLLHSKQRLDLDQAGRQFNSSKSYWFFIKGDMIEKLDESLSKVLVECDYTKIRSCIVSTGVCKLSLYKIETDETGLKQETRKA